MLAKLNHNNYPKIVGLFLIIFTLFSCSVNRKIFDTEVSCAKVRVIVRFADAKEVKNAIEKALEDKKKYNSNENYTVIRLPGNRSFRIEKLTPEDAIKCSLRDYEVNVKYKKVEQYYH